VCSLLPPTSSSEEGLHFQVYTRRFARFFGVEEAQVEAILPADRQVWRYFPSAGPDLTGFEGRFKDPQDVERFLDGLDRLSGTTSGPAS